MGIERVEELHAWQEGRKPVRLVLSYIRTLVRSYSRTLVHSYNFVRNLVLVSLPAATYRLVLGTLPAASCWLPARGISLS